MSRLDGQEVKVWIDDTGHPQAVLLSRERYLINVLGIRDRWREWFDALDGGPERDVWLVELNGHGWCELHHLRKVFLNSSTEGENLSPGTEAEPADGTWLLARWED